MAKISQGTNTSKTIRRLIPTTLLMTVGALIFAAAPALAAQEKPEVSSVEDTTAVVVSPSTEALLHGVLNPASTGEEGTYKFLYKKSITKTCTGESETTEGLSPTGEREEPAEAIAGLTPGTEYAVCLRVENNAKTSAVTSTAVTFTTPLHPETPEPKPANPIAANTATLNGTLNPAAPGNPGTYEFRYRQSPTECQGGEPEEEKATPATKSLGGKGEAANAMIAELLPHTPYTFCLLTKNEAGEEALSAPETFTTLATAPAIEEQSASEVSATGAKLNATVNPGGAATTYAFEYAPAGSAEFKPVAEPGASGTLPEGTSGVAVSVKLQRGLAPSSSYQFRVVVENEKSKAAGKPVVGEPPVSFTTQSLGGEFVLPDARQYEMVSPPAKQGAYIFRSLENRAVVQASAAGNAIAYVADSPTEAAAQGNEIGLAVLSTRGAGGWSSRTLTPPRSGAGGAGASSESPGEEEEYFSEDLSHALTQQEGAFTPLSPEASEQTPYIQTDYLNGDPSQFCSQSCFAPLVTRANTRPGASYGTDQDGTCIQSEVCGPRVLAATHDLRHVILGSETQLTTTLVVPPTEQYNGRGFMYEWTEGGGLLPVSVLPGGNELSEGALAGGNAISENGNRVVFTGNGFSSGVLYLRDLGKSETIALDLPEPGCLPPGGTCTQSTEMHYVTANSEGTRVFFLDAGRLTSDSGAATERPDLYEYNLEAPEGHRLTDLTPETESGESADVVATLAVSDNGSYVYFLAGGLLAPGAAPGTCGAERSSKEGCGVYVYHAGTTRLLARHLGLINEPEGIVSPDGRWFAFMSAGDLTGYDTRDVNEQEGSNGPVLPASKVHRDAEVYLYHAPENLASGGGTLVCASCNPTGARPAGLPPETTIERYNPPGYHLWTAAYPSSIFDSGRLLFESYDGLVPKDVNGAEDVYEYEPEKVPAGKAECSPADGTGSSTYTPERDFDGEGVKGVEPAGCVSLISAGASSDGSSFLAASEGDGADEHGETGSEGARDVFFWTRSQLVPQDVDSAPDVYDAHECTGASPCIAPPAASAPPCGSEASCKAAPTPQPEIYGAPSSATFSGPGNLAPPPPAAAKKLTKKTVKCKRGFVKNKKDKCVRKKRKKKAKRATNDRRGN